MGGVDKDNATGQVLQALSASNLPSDLSISVIMGHQAPFLNEVQKQVSQMPFPTEVLVGVNNMPQLMTESDLCIGAAGSTAWERCCLGLPTLMLVLADNQIDIAVALERSGASITLNSPQSISRIFEKHLTVNVTSVLKVMGQAALNVTDGKGTLRIIKTMVAEKLNA
jgi:spore coat polysaccharide biosynthesis predicted glycosyltransferase SpsG